MNPTPSRGSTEDLRAVQLLGRSAGGIRAHVALLAGALEHRGISAPVLGPPGVMAGLGPQAGEVPVPTTRTPFGILRARRALRPWRDGASLLHCHGLKAGWTALGGAPRRPVVLTVHNVVLDEKAGRAARAQRVLERRVLAGADRVIALNQVMADGLDGIVAPDRLRIALPASAPPRPRRSRTEVRRELGLGGEQPLVACVGRLHPQKDIATLLRAWVEVARNHPDAVLAVIGDGPSRPELEALHAELHLGSSARLLGAVPHAVDVLAAADVAAVTSVWEGVPLVLAETMQLGLPVVSTPVGVAPELLRPDPDGRPVGGQLVPVGDESAVAAALCAMLDAPEAAAEAGRRGRERAVETFDPDRAVQAVVDIYREVAP